MKRKVLSITLSSLLISSLIGCSTSQNTTLPSAEQVQANANSKSLTFKQEDLDRNSKDENVNTSARKVVIKLNKTKATKNSVSSQAYKLKFMLEDAVEKLHNMAAYDPNNSKAGNEVNLFVDKVNKGLINEASKSDDLNSVKIIANILQRNAAKAKWRVNGKRVYSIKYSSLKIINAHTYNFLLQNFNDENGFDVSSDKVLKHFANLPLYSPEYDDACYYMYEAVAFISSVDSRFRSLINELDPFRAGVVSANAKGWRNYSNQLRDTLNKLSKSYENVGNRQ